MSVNNNLDTSQYYVLEINEAKEQEKEQENIQTNEFYINSESLQKSQITICNTIFDYALVTTSISIIVLLY